MRVWPVIEQSLHAHGTCVMVTVARTEGSTPRETGARLIVTPEGFHGTIGGGTLEWKALALAQRLLGGAAGVKRLVQSLGPDLGQCCGGRVTLAVEVFDGSSLPSAAELARREEQGPFETGSRIASLPFTEQFGERRRQVMIFGAGHVGRALMLALAPLPFDVRLIDPRREQLPSVTPGNVTVDAGDPVTALQGAPAGSFAFIMSHSHALDLVIADAALRNPDILHVGLIGSDTKRARFERRLADAGIDRQRIDAMICPIGIEGIRSKHPAAIAASVAAQMVMLHEAAQGAAETSVPILQLAEG